MGHPLGLWSTFSRENPGGPMDLRSDGSWGVGMRWVVNTGEVCLEGQNLYPELLQDIETTPPTVENHQVEKA